MSIRRFCGAWRLAGVAAGLGVLSSAASGQFVYVLSSGNASLDDAVVSVLGAHGLTATIGPQYWEFVGAADLCSYDCIYMQANANWNFGNMPEGGQQAIVDLINRGGGFVTSEWSVWKSGAGSLLTLAAAFA